MERTDKMTEETCVWGVGPSEMLPGIVYVFIENGVPLMVDFLCPCGCGRSCPTHLVTPDHVKTHGDRHWEYRKGPTLVPSIRWTSGCKAHFTITDGVVNFHADSGA